MASGETSIVGGCINELTGRGAWVQKFHGTMWTSRGIPDLIACWRGLFLAVECKRPGERPTAAQRFVHGRIRRAGGHVFVAHSRAELAEQLDRLAATNPGRVAS